MSNAATILRIAAQVCIGTALTLRFVNPSVAGEAIVITAGDKKLQAELENKEMLDLHGGGPVVALVQPTNLGADVLVGVTGGLNDGHFSAIARELRDTGVASIRADL
jgi:hypothetical protein